MLALLSYKFCSLGRGEPPGPPRSVLGWQMVHAVLGPRGRVVKRAQALGKFLVKISEKIGRKWCLSSATPKAASWFGC